MKLLIVIANYRVTDLTLDCLRSLSQEVPLLDGVRVEVCENGTGEEDYRRIRDEIGEQGWQGWASVMAISPNRGFTGGNNLILEPALRRASTPDYFLLLNADTLVLPNSVRQLIDFMDASPHVGIAGSRLEDPDGTPQESAFRFHNFVDEFSKGLRLGIVARLLRRWSTVRPIPSGPCRTDWVSGAAMIIRREVFESIGVLDDGYYTYFDDVDFCFVARQAGWQTWYYPTSRIIHLAGRSTGIGSGIKEKRRPSYWFQARRRYFVKNGGPVGAVLADAGFIAGFSLRRLRSLLTGHSDNAPEHFLRDSIRHSVFRTGFKVRAVENPLLKEVNPT